MSKPVTLTPSGVAGYIVRSLNRMEYTYGERVDTLKNLQNALYDCIPTNEHEDFQESSFIRQVIHAIDEYHSDNKNIHSSCNKQS